MSDTPKCELCDEPMPEGEEMFKYHGYSGPCPNPPLPRKPTEIERLTAELNQARAELKDAQDKAAEQGRYACEMFDECKRAQIAEREAESKLAAVTKELEQLRARYAGAVGLLKKYRELTKGASPNDWHAFYEATAEALSSTPQSIKDVMKAMKEMRGLLLFALWHHQGGSSEVGQPIRKFLGIGEYDHLTQEQIAEAKEAVRKLEAK